MKSPFTKLKEAGLQAALTAFINREIEALGLVKDLAIDTKQKAIQLKLALKGEPSPIVISVASYELSERNGAAYIALQNVQTSREWITAALKQYVVGRAFPLPSAASRLL
jgi:hypothetical protein